jgi:glycosyltransferase involved in cell wall biosynthesis
MAPQVSVIIKSYNHAAFVGQTIESIIEQSFQDFELLVLDDGSSDETPAIVASFKDPRLHLEVSVENRGISAAMNSLIARAQGEYIAILNSDDFALPGRLEKQAQLLAAEPEVGALFTLPETVDDFGKPTESYFDFSVAFTLPDFSRTSWLRFFFFHANCLCAPTAMIRRVVYDRAGEYDRKLTSLQDLDMWIRVATTSRIHVLREKLTAFRIHSEHGNLSAPRVDTRLRSQFEYSRILKHYRSMERSTLMEVFAPELAKGGIDLARSPDHWLSEIALTAGSPAHRLFALETLFDCCDGEDDIRRLRDLTATVNIFGL